MKKQLTQAQRKTGGRHVELEQKREVLKKRVSELTKHLQRLQAQKQHHEEQMRAAHQLLDQRQQQLVEQREIQRQTQSWLDERAQQMTRQQRKLEADAEKLKSEQEEFGRYLKIDAAQRQLLANLDELRREKSSWHRFVRWLADLRPSE